MPGMLTSRRAWEVEEPVAYERLPLPELLAFAAKHRYPDRAEIWHTFHVPMVRYAQELNWALDDPAALKVNPDLVVRLQTDRAARRIRRGQVGQLFDRCQVCGHPVGAPLEAGDPVLCGGSNPADGCGASNYTMGRR